MHLTSDTFESEIREALQAYDKYVVCLNKTPDECEASLRSLVDKAIDKFVNREPHLRHGIALDRQVTVILSQTDGPRPLCGIYFNLSSPYHKQTACKPTRPSASG
ncbi:MAG: hypothetical protein AB1705_13695 [Verrucomicrobiota bacterium]